jgi:hypothetical protein
VPVDIDTVAKSVSEKTDRVKNIKKSKENILEKAIGKTRSVETNTVEDTTRKRKTRTDGTSLRGRDTTPILLLDLAR